MLLTELELREGSCKFIIDLVGNENRVMLNSMKKLGFKSSDLITFYKMINKWDKYLKKYLDALLRRSLWKNGLKFYF